MPPTERLFFGIWPPEGTRRALDALQQRLHVRGRSSHPLDLHLTLVFLGEVSIETRRCAERAVDTLVAAPFEMAIERLGYWPRPRILWAGPTQTPAPLSQLVADLRETLKGCGLEPERRPYTAHVTLRRKARAVPFGTAFEALDPPIPWPVREFVLARSGQTQAPPRYEILRLWQLTGEVGSEPPAVG